MFKPQKIAISTFSVIYWTRFWNASAFVDLCIRQDCSYGDWYCNKVLKIGCKRYRYNIYILISNIIISVHSKQSCITLPCTKLTTFKLLLCHYLLQNCHPRTVKTILTGAGEHIPFALKFMNLTCRYIYHLLPQHTVGITVITYKHTDYVFHNQSHVLIYRQLTLARGNDW